jgi:DNA invertase Pin-like site-specific DNA recombinase
MAWAAKMERLAIDERVAPARERLAAVGRPWGRSPRLSVREVAAIEHTLLSVRNHYDRLEA